MLLLFVLSILTVVLKSNATCTTEKVDKLNCYYYNATSIRGKLVEFNMHFDAYEYDLISVTETNLKDSVYDGEILTNRGYNLFRRDRTKEIVPDKESGGGVLLAVKSTVSAKRRKDLETNIEIVWVEITLSEECSLFVTYLLFQLS